MLTLASRTIVLIFFFAMCGLSWLAIYKSSSYQECSTKAACTLRCRILFNDLKQETLAPDIVAFAIEIFAWRFTVLPTKFSLLLPDPAKFRDC